MSRAFATVIFGLAASLCWGSGDFSGGLASRRANASSVVTAAYAVGFVLLLALALIWREPFPAPLDIVWGGLAVLAGAIGLIAFYTALSIGRMVIAAPGSAVLTATIPVLFSTFTEGLPNLLQLGGFMLALLAIVLISRPERSAGRPEGLGLALLAGCGFGCFFILISRVSHDSTFWPLAVARFSSVLFLLVVGGIRRQPVLPRMTAVPLVLIAGVLDAIGNAFFGLSSHSGLLHISAVLTFPDPESTVLLSAHMMRLRATLIHALRIL